MMQKLIRGQDQIQTVKDVGKSMKISSVQHIMLGVQSVTEKDILQISVIHVSQRASKVPENCMKLMRMNQVTQNYSLVA
jgi:hypothetical protein